jgi:hypothetical protein
VGRLCDIFLRFRRWTLLGRGARYAWCNTSTQTMIANLFTIQASLREQPVEVAVLQRILSEENASRTHSGSSEQTCCARKRTHWTVIRMSLRKCFRRRFSGLMSCTIVCYFSDNAPGVHAQHIFPSKGNSRPQYCEPWRIIRYLHLLAMLYVLRSESLFASSPVFLILLIRLCLCVVYHTNIPTGYVAVSISPSCS